MRYILLTIVSVVVFTTGHAQITITAADMPVAGDTFIYSNVSTTATTISPADSGANFTWNYALTATSQGMDIYKTHAQVSPFLSFSLPSDIYGYQTADSIPGIGLLASGVTIQNLYTFFEKIDIPSAYVASAFSATISSFPVGTNYTEPDVWYIFPLTYGNVDSNNYELDISLLTYGALKEAGYRKTTVDGWGTITTPYYTTPTPCIRVRSEIHEVDSITISGFPLGIPRNTVEYKWLVNGDHQPALWVTSNVLLGAETVSTIKYRDRLPVVPPDTTTAVRNVQNETTTVSAYPNPSASGVFTLSIPKGWTNYQVAVYDVQSRLVATQQNEPVINIQSLPAGNYVARVLCGDKMAFVPIVK